MVLLFRVPFYLINVERTLSWSGHARFIMSKQDVDFSGYSCKFLS